MQQSYSEFIRTDHAMGTQRILHIMLGSITGESIREGIFKSNKTDIGMGSLYNRLFLSTTSSTQRIAAHRLRLYLQDGMEKEAVEQLEKILFIHDSSIFPILNQSFIMAVVSKMPGVVQAFLIRGFPKSINSRIFGGNKNLLFPTYFHLALGVQNLSVIMAFFKRTIDYQETWHGIGPVHLAAINPDIRILDMVLTHGNPLEYTTTIHYELLCCLIKRKEEVELLREGRPIYPIDLAVLANNWGALLLLMRKAQKSIRLSQHLLHILNSFEMAAKAITLGARVEQLTATGASILHTKASMNKAEMCAFYIGYGVSLEEKNYNGETPLMCALKKGNKEASWVLIKHGANITPALASHPIFLEILHGWEPEAALREKIEHYKYAGSQTLKHPKPKSRFSITGLFNPGKYTVEQDIQKINSKIEKLSHHLHVSSTRSLSTKEAYEEFLKLISKQPKDSFF
ncbi:hypothetical protein NEFER03_1083 [Nematocida sp. LUAm3]|nr:hypothetical protein NEFER03_1083 [Nematocida sp. LUAm3]KAI5175312.1 hypothetical protein NEFER02_1241 [Nematocida sp. LUAm2]KAI5177731.1 hypothetical protein NEFER01_0955 [Nematocida sp. LUAm1]